jgi:hypothetical protein
MPRRKTPIALKRRIGKTSVSLCVLFDMIPFLTQVLVLISSDGETIKDDVSSHILILFFPVMFKYVLALEETASGPTSNWIHPSCKHPFYFIFFFKVLIIHGQAIFDSCHSCSLLGGFFYFESVFVHS